MPERIIIGRDTLEMYSLPLSHLDSMRSEIFDRLVREGNRTYNADRTSWSVVESTALWRDYRGTWQLRRDTLRLLGVENAAGKPIDISELFGPEEPAHWFSGEIVVGSPNYVNSGMLFGFSLISEYETIYRLEKGVVRDSVQYHNRVSTGQEVEQVQLPFAENTEENVQKLLSRFYPACKACSNVVLWLDITPDSTGRMVDLTSSIYLDRGRYEHIEPIEGSARFNAKLKRKLKFTDKLPWFLYRDTIRPWEKAFRFRPVEEMFVPDRADFSRQLFLLIRKYYPDYTISRKANVHLAFTTDRKGRITKKNAWVTFGWGNNHFRIEEDTPCMQELVRYFDRPVKKSLMGAEKAREWKIRLVFYPPKR